MKHCIILFLTLFAVNWAIGQTAPPPPPPPPAPPEQGAADIFKVVEQMPEFPGCEDLVDKGERGGCAKQKMLEYTYKNLKYPTEAMSNGTEGMVVVQFVVSEIGNVEDVKLLRDIGDGCGQAAIDLVESMPKWNPGKQRGQAVKVLFTFPVRFKI